MGTYRPTSPSTSLGRFESNFKGSRGFPIEYFGTIYTKKTIRMAPETLGISFNLVSVISP